MRFYILTLAVLLAAGCSSFQGAPKAVLDPARDEFGTTVLNHHFLGDEGKSKLQAYLGGPRSQPKRNQIVFARLAEIDALYGEFELAVFAESRNIGFLASLAGIVSGGVGGLIGETGSQIASAVSGSLAGAQAAFDKEVLVDRTVQAFITQMRATRASVKADILTNLQGDTIVYPIEAAMGDLERYRQAGTLASALVGVSERAAEAEAEANEKVEEAAADLRVGLNEANKGLERFLRGGSFDPASKFDAVRVAALNDCVGELDIRFPGAANVPVFSHDAAVDAGGAILLGSYLGVPNRQEEQAQMLSCVRSKAR